MTYEAETASSQSKRDSLVKDIAEMKQEKQTLQFPTDRNGNVEKRELDFHGWKRCSMISRVIKQSLLNERIEMSKAADEARQKRDAYVKDHLLDLTPAQIKNLRTSSTASTTRSGRFICRAAIWLTAANRAISASASQSP